MTHFVNQRCIRCKYTDCVDVCPVDCFCEGEKFLVIDPEVCIDCGVCVAECPVEAIVNDDTTVGGAKFSEVVSAYEAGETLEGEQADNMAMYRLNVHYAKLWPAITQSKQPLPEAAEFKDNLNKLPYIESDFKEISQK